MADQETWRLALSVLMAGGLNEVTSRALIGKHLKSYSEQDVVDAYTAAAGKADPRSYACKILKTRPQKVGPTQERLMPAEPVASRERARAALGRARAVLTGTSKTLKAGSDSGR